jgi:hypothetical protein
MADTVNSDLLRVSKRQSVPDDGRVVVTLESVTSISACRECAWRSSAANGQCSGPCAPERGYHPLMRPP